MNQNSLVEDKLSSLFFRFVIPSIAAMVLSGMQGMLDGIFLGNFAGSNAMAGVNIANPYMQVIFGSTMVVCTGTLSHLGRTLGEKNWKKAEDIFKSSIFAMAVLSGGIMLLGILFHKNIAYLLGANEALVEYASQYIFVIAFFAPAMSFMILLGFADRLLEKPELYLKATVYCLLTNVILDYAAVKVLSLGVRGAAAATGIAYLAGLLTVAGPALSRKSVVHIFAGRFNGRLLKHSVYNGSSEGVTYVSAALAMFLFNRTFIGIAGEDGVAAFTVINYIGNFVTLIMFGISDGIGSIVSCNFGAAKLNRVRRTFYGAVGINSAVGILVFFVLNLFSGYFVTLFLKDGAPVAAMASAGARIYALGFLFNGFNIIQSGYQTSVGNALESFVIAGSRGIVFIIVGILVLPKLLGINGVWLTLPFAEAMTFAVCLFIMERHKRLYCVPKGSVVK